MPRPSGWPGADRADDGHGAVRRADSPWRVRRVLLLAVVAGLVVLAAVVVTDPRRIGLFEPRPGRTSAPDEAAWTLAAPAPVALTEVAAAVHDGRIWVVGGMDDQGRAVDLVQVYDPTTDSWSAGPSLPVAVHHAALVADDRSLLLIGGYAGADGRPTDAVWRLAVDGTAWVPGEPLPEARAAGAAAWDGRGHVLYGGGVGPGGASGTVFVCDGGRAGLAGPRRAQHAPRAPGRDLGRCRLGDLPGRPGRRPGRQPGHGRPRLERGCRRPDRGPDRGPGRYRGLLHARAG